MKYCSNCGHELINDPKYCPSCGFKIEQPKDNEKPKLHKRESKSLKDSIVEEAKGKAQDIAQDQLNKIQRSNKSRSPKKSISNNQNQTKEEQNSKLGLWTMVYIIANILLSFADSSDEKIGLLFFSVVILLAVILRRKKPKPYNVVVKIILVVQVLFTIALIGGGFEDGYWSVNILYLIALLIAQIMVLFKGKNKLK